MKKNVLIVQRPKEKNLAGFLILHYSIYNLKKILEVISAECKSNILSEKSILCSKLLIMA